MARMNLLAWGGVGHTPTEPVKSKFGGAIDRHKLKAQENIDIFESGLGSRWVGKDRYQILC